jgi:cytochrome c peroxidase
MGRSIHCAIALLGALLGAQGCSIDPPATKERLGSLLFSDTNLSNPPGQSCADCHMPSMAFRDPETSHSTSMGVIPGRFGARHAPSILYASYVPALQRDARGDRWIGGLFWDGRASTLEAQAGVPLLNPLEMNNPDKARVVTAIRLARYAPAFRERFGPRALDDVDTAFSHVLEALAAFERTAVFAPFTSKYDRYLAGGAALSDAEQRGLAIFEDPARGNCASCHPSRPAPDGSPPLFTDFSYANLGIPKYANNKFLVQPPMFNPEGERYIDHGLMATVGDAAQDGKFRVPTLRNIVATAPYGHNGYFDSLLYLLDFLNTRDIGSFEVGTCSRGSAAMRCGWPGAEVPATVERRVGHLGLSDPELDDLAAFLATLTDEPAGGSR